MWLQEGVLIFGCHVYDAASDKQELVAELALIWHLPYTMSLPADNRVGALLGTPNSFSMMTQEQLVSLSMPHPENGAIHSTVKRSSVRTKANVLLQATAMFGVDPCRFVLESTPVTPPLPPEVTWTPPAPVYNPKRPAFALGVLSNNTPGSAKLLRAHWASPAQLRSLGSDGASRNSISVWCSENVAAMSSASTSVGALNRGCTIWSVHAAPPQGSTEYGIKLGEVLCGWNLGGGMGLGGDREPGLEGGVAVRCGPPGIFSTQSASSLVAILSTEQEPAAAAPVTTTAPAAVSADGGGTATAAAVEAEDVVIGGVNVSELGSNLWGSMSAKAQKAKDAMEAARAKAEAELEKSRAEVEVAEAAKKEKAIEAATAAPESDAPAAATAESETSMGGWGASLRNRWSAASGSGSPRDSGETPEAESEVTGVTVAAPTNDAAAAADLASKSQAARAAELAAKAPPAPAPAPVVELTPTEKKLKSKAEKLSQAMRAGLPFSMLGGVHCHGMLYATAALGRPGMGGKEEEDEALASFGEGWPDAFSCYFSVTVIDEVFSSDSESEDDQEALVVLDIVEEEDEEEEDEEEEDVNVAEPEPELEPAATGDAAPADVGAAADEKPGTAVAPAEEPTKEARLKAKELMWTDMLPAEQAAAILLGWNAAMWDEGETPACVDMHWAELSVAEVGAATTMGYTEEDWDAEEEDDGGDETLRV